MRLRSLRNLIDNPRKAIIAILLVSLTVRIAFVLTMEREGFYFIDTTDYDKAATKLVQEGTFGLEYERPPVYPLFLAAVYSISFQNLLLVRITQCLLGTLICLLVILILLVTYFFLRGQETGFLIDFLIAGLFMGLAILTKPISIFLLVLLVAYLIVKKRSLGSGYLLSLFLFLFCTVMVTSIWVTRNYFVKGEISLIESNKKLEGHLRSLDKAPKEIPLSIGSRLNRIFFQQGDRFLRHFGSELIHFWEVYPTRIATEDNSNRELFKKWDKKFQTNNPYIGNFGKYISILSFTPVFVLGIVGFLLSIQKGKQVFLLISPILSFWFGYSLFYAKTRYRIPVEPFLIIFAAWSLTTFQVWISAYLTRKSRISTFHRGAENAEG
jgi:4-amino-4-deoxy-L-arabinose transferase-like glycosyltransferase